MSIQFIPRKQVEERLQAGWQFVDYAVMMTPPPQEQEAKSTRSMGSKSAWEKTADIVNEKNRQRFLRKTAP